MKYYIDGISSYSNHNFEQLKLEYFNNDTLKLITTIPEKYISGKGLRHVPRTAKLLYVSVVNLIDKYGLQSKIKDTSLYNTSNICSLEPHLEFEKELDEYGAQLANPMMTPYKLAGVHTGWIALKESMNNINLSINSGRCGILTALKSYILDVLDDNIRYGIITGGNFMGDSYQKFNFVSSIKKEFTYSLLVTNKVSADSLIEINEIKVNQFNTDIIEKLFVDFENHNIILDSDIPLDFVNYANNQSITIIKNTTSQTSLLPFYINGLKSDAYKTNNEFIYIINDKRGIMGYVKFKIL